MLLLGVTVLTVGCSSGSGNGGGCGSNCGVTIPATPTGLAATPGNGQVALTWTASAGATSYNVKRGTANGGPYTTVASPTAADYTDTNLTNGTPYYYVVSAVNSAGESANSSQVSTTPIAPVAMTYYIDCSQASNGSGTQASPWNTINSVNAQTLNPGDSVLFARGTTCNGMLNPTGSGSSSAVITLDAYGTGALPIIDGGTSNQYALYLNDEQYYQINNLALQGGNTWTVSVNGNIAGNTLHHIHMANLDVSGVHAVGTTPCCSGLVYVSPSVCNGFFDDVLIDGVVAHDTTGMEGIHVNGAGWCDPTTGVKQQVGGTVTVQNSTGHDVYGDGIVVTLATNTTIQNSVAYNTGLCPSTICNGQTSSGLWHWFSTNALVQNNESYDNRTYEVGHDGGDYDIDTQNSNAVYQYNYGHGSDGYCVSILGQNDGTNNPTTSNSVVRYNICANDLQVDQNYGEILIFTWNGGQIDGVQVYNNTIYLDTNLSSDYALMDYGTTYTGTTPNFFMNNLIYSEVPGMIDAQSKMTLNNNLYYNAAGTGYSFYYAGQTYSTFASYQAGSGQDANAVNADPMLNGAGYDSPGSPTLSNGYYTLQSGSPAIGAGADVCSGSGGCIGGTMGTQDYFGQPLTSTHNIGADD